MQTYGARWQLPEFRHAATSEHVAGRPSIVQLHPNCEHHHCWPRDIDLYPSELAVTRVPEVAQADNSAQSMTATSVPLGNGFIR